MLRRARDDRNYHANRHVSAIGQRPAAANMRV
jgi:hypothetical protein